LLTSIDDIIAVAGAPTVPGLTFRRFRGQSDYPAITAVGNASRLADGHHWAFSTEEVAVKFDQPVNSDPARDVLVAAIDGEMIGFAHGRWSQEMGGDFRYSLSVELLPEWRGRGIRRTLFHWLEARLRQVAAEHPADAGKAFRANAPETAEELTALLLSEGYQPVRVYNTMVCSLEDPLPDFPMPAGLELRPALPEHYRLIWEASREAFQDHWGSSVASEAAYQAFLADLATYTPDLWQVAWDSQTNEIAGQVLTCIIEHENEAFNRRRGYSETISVRRPYRRRGLARAMIAESLRVLKAQGMTESALGVDSENLTGAVRLYEDCGFRTVQRDVAYRKPLNPSNGEDRP